jgi:hypothetical protein
MNKIKDKLFFNAIYLIMSILIYKFFSNLKQTIKCEINWTMKDFEKLYNYSSKDVKKLEKAK